MILICKLLSKKILLSDIIDGDTFPGGSCGSIVSQYVQSHACAGSQIVFTSRAAGNRCVTQIVFRGGGLSGAGQMLRTTNS